MENGRVKERQNKEWIKKINSITFPPAIRKQIEQQAALVSGTPLFSWILSQATNSAPKCIQMPPAQAYLYFQGSGGKMAYSGLCTVLSPLIHHSIYDTVKKFTSSLTKHNTFPIIQNFFQRNFSLLTQCIEKVTVF